MNYELSKVRELEARGWEVWLKTVFPFAFSKPFAPFHREFWDLWWEICLKIRDGVPVEEEKLTIMCLWGRALAKCLDGDTKITLADGTHQTIRDIEVGTPIMSYNEPTGKFERDVISNKWVSGYKQCLQITMKSGKILILTPEHRIYTITGWKAAGEIVSSDRIASPRKVDIDPTDNSRTDEEVRLLAYFIAEGCTREHYIEHRKSLCLTATITNADAPIIEDVFHCAESLGFKAKKGKRYTIYLSGGVRDWIRENGLAGKPALNKRLPDWVFKLPKRQKWQFISAFIDTDGWIGQNGKIGITLANKELVKDLQDLLLQVGVPSNFKYRHNDCAGAWQLMFDQEGVNVNKQFISLKAKSERLKKYLETRRYSLMDTYPYQTLRGLPFGVGKSIQRAGLSITKRYSATRKKLRDAIEIYPYPRWVELENADVLWDEVVSVSDAGIRETFDVEVEKNHNLITNNLISHNSSSGTPSTLMKAAIVGRIYSLYLSETFEQAAEHLSNVRFLIMHPGSRLAEFYPHLALDGKGTAKMGLKGKDAEGIFITTGGSVFRAFGLDSSGRGIGLAGRRPDDYNVDDVDNLNHSISVSNNIVKKITRNFLMTQDLVGDIPVTTKILQNLIIEHGFVNQVFKHRTDALAERTVIGIVNTFAQLDIETAVEPETGKLKHTIQPSSVPTWEAVSLPVAQKILNLLGLEGFMAECQNDFALGGAGRVIPEYNEEAQIITWSQFERVYGARQIPAHWRIKAGLDIGYSEGAHPHYSAWVFVATSALNSRLPGKVFLAKGRGFKAVSIDEQAEIIKSELANLGGQIRQWQMSHERTGEMLTLNRKYELPFTKFKYYRAEDGVAQWRHLSRADKRKPHPFKKDERTARGEWRIGCPALFYIVDDDQLAAPRDDNGLRLFREQVSTWEYVPVKITESGQTAQKPSKVNDDFCDAFKATIALWGADAAPLTIPEMIEAAKPEILKAANQPAHLPPGREMAIAEAEARIKKNLGLTEDEDEFWEYNY